MKSLSLKVYRAEDSRTYLSRLRALESKGENWQGLAGVEKVLSMKYWEIIADKLSAAGWSWG